MRCSRQLIVDTLKKLPIGYYLGRGIPVMLDDDIPTSLYRPTRDEIHISYPQIKSILKKIPGRFNTKDTEEIIRTLLYHELSHTMLTPKTLKNNSAVNIVEDERIERKLNGFFRDINFKKINYLLNHGVENTKPSDYFFDLVRFGKGPETYLERVETLLKDYDSLNSSSSSSYARRYREEIMKLYREFMSYLFITKVISEEEYKEELERIKSEDLQEEIIVVALGNGKESEDEDDSLSSLGGLSSLEDCFSKEELEEMSRGAIPADSFPSIKEEFKTRTETFINQRLITEFNRIISQVNKINNKNGSACHSYSGVFDPRAAARKDYKFFVQKNRNGDSRGYSKIHINLFLDRSGSFKPNEPIANQVIYALYYLEKSNPDFSFTLITCGCGERIEDKKDILFVANDGNWLDKDIWDIFKKVQEKQKVNYNIVLFDGEATYGPDICNFGAFNTSNTLIISDPDNKKAIERYAPSARSIITKNYTEELIDNLINLLGCLVK